MKSVIVNDPKKITIENNYSFISAGIGIDKKNHIVNYRVNEDLALGNPDFLLPVVLEPAMSMKRGIVCNFAISEKLAKAIPDIQGIYRRLDPRLKIVPVDHGKDPLHSLTQAREIGCLFSGGVDSFYTLLKHKHEITKVILVHGFDIPLSDRILRKQTANMVHKVASGLNKGVVEVETDMRRNFLNRYLGIADTISPFFASVALLLSSQFKKIYFPACFHKPLSCSAIGHYRAYLDPLWSNGHLQIIHDGDDVNRIEKIAFIAKNNLVREHLHVCWMNNNGVDNCGYCGKCLRTMAALRVVGQLEYVNTFKRPLKLARLSKLVLSKTERIFAGDTLRYAQQLGRDPEIIAALNRCLSNKHGFNIKMWLISILEKLRQSYYWSRFYNIFPEKFARCIRAKVYAIILK